MEVILSIKPVYVERIFDGSKKYEFRKSIFKDKRVNKVIIYATAPIKMIVGEFEIDHIINDGINALWEETSVYSGISKDLFSEYFANRNVGYAIKIKAPKRYKKPICIKEVYKKSPPQSFMYA